MVLLLIILAFLVVSYFIFYQIIGSAPSPVDEVIEIMRPYLKEFGTKKIEKYLEDRYDLRASQIRMIKKKKGKAPYKYLYSLVDYIVNDNDYDVYEFLDESQIDGSSFSGKEVDPYDSPGEYTAREEETIRKIARDMGISMSTYELRKFITSNVYHMKVGRKYVIDTIPIMLHLWLKNKKPTHKEVYVPRVRQPTEYLRVVDVERDVARARDQLRREELLEREVRDAKAEKSRLEQEAREAKDRLEREAREAKDQLEREKRQMQEEALRREEEYQRDAFEKFRIMWRSELNTNPEYANDVNIRLENGEHEEDIFEEWVFNNKDIMGAREQIFGSGEKISRMEARRKLSNMLKMVHE
jgi:hypothetical protein